MDAIMGHGSSLYGSILNGLDIVAATYRAANRTSYPASVQYGLVVGFNTGVLMFPVCFKVGMTGVYVLSGMIPQSSGAVINSVQLSTSSSNYSTGGIPISIIWFG